LNGELLLNQVDARRIIQTVGAAGQPPPWGAHYFTDGFEPTLKLLEEDYFSDYLKQGGAVFKLVVGHYGGGKTHFLYLLRDLAWRMGFVVAYVSLTPEETPFHRLDLVYRAIASGLATADARDSSGGLHALLKSTVGSWKAKTSDPAMLQELVRSSTYQLENLSYLRAMQKALTAVIEEDEDKALSLVQWLSGQGFDRAEHSPHGILSPIDRSQAFSCLRSLARWIRQAGHSGLVILFDEAERAPSLSGKQKEFMLSNLRELIDETARGTLPGTLVGYAIPDYRFFDGKTGVYEAVKQRTASMFDIYNPSGVRVDLEALVKNADVEKHLCAIGLKLMRIFEVGYAVELPQEQAEKAIDLVARAVKGQRFADISYRRLFVQSMVKAFEQLRRVSGLDVNAQWAGGIVDSYISGNAL